MTASVGSTTTGSGRSSKRTSPGPWITAPRMSSMRRPAGNPREMPAPPHFPGPAPRGDPWSRRGANLQPDPGVDVLEPGVLDLGPVQRVARVHPPGVLPVPAGAGGQVRVGARGVAAL